MKRRRRRSRRRNEKNEWNLESGGRGREKGALRTCESDHVLWKKGENGEEWKLCRLYRGGMRRCGNVEM